MQLSWLRIHNLDQSKSRLDDIDGVLVENLMEIAILDELDKIEQLETLELDVPFDLGILEGIEIQHTIVGLIDRFGPRQKHIGPVDFERRVLEVALEVP